MDDKSQTALDPKVLNKRIYERLAPLDEMSFLERYAMFMGKAQIVEMAMKGILHTRYGVEEKNLEKMTMGQALHELRGKGMRNDFIKLLEDLVQHRNDLAHSFLRVDAVGKSLIGHEFERLSEKQLKHALYSVEEVIQVHDFLEEHNLW